MPQAILNFDGTPVPAPKVSVALLQMLWMLLSQRESSLGSVPTQ